MSVHEKLYLSLYMLVLYGMEWSGVVAVVPQTCSHAAHIGSAVTFGAEMQCCMLRVTVYADGSSLPSR